MAFRVKDDFQAKQPISQVPAAWFNAVGSFINRVVGGFGISTKKSDSGKMEISLNRETLNTEIDNAMQGKLISKDTGTPEDKSDANSDDDEDGNVWTWTAGGENGLIITPYCEIEQENGWHYFGRAEFKYSKDGLLVAAKGLSGRKEIQA